MENSNQTKFLSQEVSNALERKRERLGINLEKLRKYSLIQNNNKTKSKND